MVSALRSPLFGVSDEDLVLHKLAGGSFNYRAPEVVGSPEAVRDAFAVLRGLHAIRHRLAVAEFVEEAWARTRAFEIFLLKPAGEQRVANLAKFVDMARAMQEADGRTIRAFVEHVFEESLGSVLTTRWKRREKEIAPLLGLPDDVEAFAILPVGHPVRRYGRGKRKPVAEITYREQHGTPW